MNADQGKFMLAQLLNNKVARQEFSSKQAIELLEEAIHIASIKSPSSAFTEGQRCYQRFAFNQMEALTFGKGIRWLAIVRRDEGDKEFQEACEELRVLAGQPVAAEQQVQQPQKGQWQLGSGEQVFDRADGSHIHVGVQNLLEPALGYIHSRERDFIAEEVNFRVSIGTSICVETREGDEIIFAQRVGHKGLSRFVKNRQPEETSWVTVVLKRRQEGGYVLLAAYIGHKAEPEPWDKRSTATSKQFWSEHALCWGYEEIVPWTETTLVPKYFNKEK